jgi:predicted HTH domain antitoxin
MTTFQVAMPETSIDYFGVPEQKVGQTVLEECAAKMYEEGKISLSQGKEMLGQESITDFMHTLYEHNTPVLDYAPGELEAEVQGLMETLA